MIIDHNNVFEIIKNAGLNPDKDYGQNYLVDPLISEKIVNALEINYQDSLLEIGPGLGSLTAFAINKSKEYTVVDIDRRMTDFLKIIYQDTQLKIINNDIRKESVSQYTKVLANLPYNITTELITYLLCNGKNISKMVLMCQEETFAHFYDIQGKEYGPISVFLHLLGNVKKEFNVKKGSFVPSPKCSSIVFSFVKNPICTAEEAKQTFFLAKSLFLSRRKTIQNNLNNLLKNKETTTQILSELGINGLKRPEDISPKQYLELYCYINKRE